MKRQARRSKDAPLRPEQLYAIAMNHWMAKNPDATPALLKLAQDELRRKCGLADAGKKRT